MNNLIELCEITERPPDEHEASVRYLCRPCRIAWAAAIQNGHYPENWKHHLRRAQDTRAYMCEPEPWFDNAIHQLEAAIARGSQRGNGELAGPPMPEKGWLPAAPGSHQPAARSKPGFHRSSTPLTVPTPNPAERHP